MLDQCAVRYDSQLATAGIPRVWQAPGEQAFIVGAVQHECQLVGWGAAVGQSSSCCEIRHDDLVGEGCTQQFLIPEKPNQWVPSTQAFATNDQVRHAVRDIQNDPRAGE